MLKQELSDTIIEEKKERYQFTWPDKTKSKLLANSPTNMTLRPCREESVNFDKTHNLYIEGDNLEALKLLRQTYFGKVKVIYIDPPYNTGKDFVYNDNFTLSRKEYSEINGDYDDLGNHMVKNSESNGRYHTDWLNMLYPRLKIARDLLAEDGVIFVSINDYENTNAEKICCELFGEYNRIANLVWTNNEGGGSSDSKYFKIKHEYIIVYAKNRDLLPEIKNVGIEDADRYKLSDEFESVRGRYQLVKLASASIQYSKSLDYEIDCPDGSKITPKENSDKDKAIWRWSKTKLQWGIENKFVVFKKDKQDIWQVYTKQYTNCDKDGNIVERTKKPIGIINRYSSTQGSNELFKLFNAKVFSYPKPTDLLVYLIDRFSNKFNDIILDFFSGSASTADAVMQLNSNDGGKRKFIMVQYPESINEDSDAFKAGYKNMCEIGKERIRRAGLLLKNQEREIDVGFRVFKIDTSNMKDSYFEPNNTAQIKLDDYIDNIKEDRCPEDLLTQVMLELNIELSSSVKIENIDKMKVFNVDDGYLLACFDKGLNENLIRTIAKREPICVAFRNSAWGSDSIACNFEQILKQYSPLTKSFVI